MKLGIGEFIFLELFGELLSILDYVLYENLNKELFEIIHRQRNIKSIIILQIIPEK